MGFSYELFNLNTETESLGEVQDFGIHQYRTMGYTIQWIKGGGYPKNLNTETESLGEVQVFRIHEYRAMGCTIQWIKGGGYPKEPGYKQREMWESHTLSPLLRFLVRI